MEIAIEIFQEVFKQLLEGKRIKLPNRLGHLELRKYRTKKIDWELTNQIYGEHNTQFSEDKKFIYHKNYHTGGYNVLLFWDKKEAMFINKNIFKLKLVRGLNRLLASHFKKDASAIYLINST